MWIKRDIDDEQESFNLGHMISGIGNSIGLVSAIIFGFLFEKGRISMVKIISFFFKYHFLKFIFFINEKKNLNKQNKQKNNKFFMNFKITEIIIQLLLITNFFTFSGYALFALCDDPYDYKVNLSISIASFGIYGLLTIGYVLVNKNCGHKARGSVMGINCLFGACGILIVAKVGGYLFDHVHKSAPFAISGVFSFLLFCMILIPKVRRSLDNPEDEDEHHH